MNPGNQVLKYFFVAVASLALFAENRAEAELEEAIKTNRYPLKVGEKELSGPGTEFVVQQGGEAAFFLIGEVHGTRETAWLTNHLLERLRPAGYAAYALETGPITTSLLIQELRTKGQDAVAKLLTDYPMTSAFLNFREELDVVGSAVKQGYQVWGIDQEFMGSAVLISQRRFSHSPPWVPLPQLGDQRESGRVLVFQLAADERVVIVDQEVALHQLGEVLLVAAQSGMRHIPAVESQNRFVLSVLPGLFVSSLDLLAQRRILLRGVTVVIGQSQLV